MGVRELLGALVRQGPAGNEPWPVINRAKAKDLLCNAVNEDTLVSFVTDKYCRLRITGPSFTIASSNATPITTATDTSLITTPGVGYKIRVYYINASNSSATTTDVSWRSSATGTQLYRNTLLQGGIFAHNLKPGYWDLTENQALVLTTSAAGSVHWTVEYEIVKV